LPTRRHPSTRGRRQAGSALALASSLLATSACQCGTDTGASDSADPGTPGLVCPDDATEIEIELQLDELPSLEGHGWRVSFDTEQAATAAVYFAPEGHDGPCELGLSSGESTRQHSLDLTNLRLGTRYDLMVGLTDAQGQVQRSQHFELTTSSPSQSIPEGFERYDHAAGEIFFDTEIYGEIPSNLVLVTSLNLCTNDYGSPLSGNQAVLLDAEGHLIGNHVTDDLITGFSQVHTTISGAPGYHSGNRDLRLHIAAGVPENSRQTSVELGGEVHTSALQPPVWANNYSFNYVHWAIDDTSALEAMGLSFIGQAHVSVISRSTKTQAFTETLIWDDALVTTDNEDDPSAWTLWSYETVAMSEHPVFGTYANTVFYDPVRNEVVVHSHSNYGGFIWGIDVATSTLAWVFGSQANQLEGYLPDDPVIISSLEHSGEAEQGFFARAHQVMVRHDPGDDPSWFYLTLHDNGGDDSDRRLHTRAIEYRMRVDSEAHAGRAYVNWAYPSNPLPEDDPLYDLLHYHNFTYGSVVQLPEHPDLYLMASGNGYCEQTVNDDGMPTQQIMTLLRSLPEEHTAEVLATWRPGSDDWPWVNMYAAYPTALYAQVDQPELESGRPGFYAATDEND
jgi:hypothetical protein